MQLPACRCFCTDNEDGTVTWESPADDRTEDLCAELAGKTIEVGELPQLAEVHQKCLEELQLHGMT